MQYVTYYRVSTKKQGLGIDAQKTIVDYYFNSDEIIGSFEEKKSGKKVNEELNKAIELCKSTGATLVIAKLDRLTRSMLDFETIYKELEGRIHSCDTSTKGSITPKEYYQMKMIFAEKERELISIRTKQALAEKKKQGVKLGYDRKEVQKGVKRYHEQKEANTTQIKTVKKEVDQKKQSIKTVIVLLKKEKKSLREIAKYLNDQGLRTSRGKMFLPTSVNRLLN